MDYRKGEIVGFVDLMDCDDACVPRVPAEWLLVRVKRLRERHVEERLQRNGVSCYLPTYERHVSVGKWKHWTISRKRKVRTPIFPGMIFVPQFDVPRVHGISSFIGGLVRMRDDAMLGEDASDPFAGFARMSHALFLYMRELERGFDQPQSRKAKARQYKPGDRVLIMEGNPFALWSGRIERLDSKGRIKVLLTIMQREVAVTGLTVEQVEPV